MSFHRHALAAIATLFAFGCAAEQVHEPLEGSVLEVRPAQFCGGIAGIACPDGYSCVDDPSDSCDPDSGGADCGGICKRDGGNGGGGGGGGGSCGSRDRKYVTRDYQQCLAIRFICADGYQPFFDENCGCGCEVIPGEPCGDGYCGDGEECCNDSCGICVEVGGFCTQQICEPATI